MTDLADFLEARIAETEQAARVWSDADPIWTPHILAECAAKRRIVQAYRIADAVCQMYKDPRDAWRWRWAAAETQVLPAVMACLAAPYAKHEDYRDEWRL